MEGRKREKKTVGGIKENAWEGAERVSGEWIRGRKKKRWRMKSLYRRLQGNEWRK